MMKPGARAKIGQISFQVGDYTLFFTKWQPREIDENSALVL